MGPEQWKLITPPPSPSARTQAQPKESFQGSPDSFLHSQGEGPLLVLVLPVKFCSTELM